MSSRHGAANDPLDNYIGAQRATQGGLAARSAVQRAAFLACLVRDEGPGTIGAYLDGLTADQLYAVVTALAAMVPVDVPATELLAWLDHPQEGAA